MGFAASAKLVLELIRFWLELWPFIKDAATENPEEYAASLRLTIAKLQSAQGKPLEERRAIARSAARDIAASIARL